MLRIMLVYGAISGAVFAAIMAAGVVFGAGTGSQLQGFLTMVVVLSLIFIGIKSYRDKELGGVIKFLPALGFGLGISVISSLFYVASWEVSLNLTDFAFIEQYKESEIAKYQANGITGEAFEEKVASLEAMMSGYTNAMIRIPITFIEIFPVGLVVSLISAAILRNPKVLPAKA